ncbi:MAG: glycosyltransferase family 2 protein [Pararhodobacter sp.]
MAEPLKRICALTMVRNAGLFLPKWVAHYGAALGRENLFVILDGHDQPVPEGLEGANILRLPHRPAPRAEGDRRRARILSDFARGLFQVHDMAIATDVDEFLVVDPAQGLGLRAYLSRLQGAAISALGMDVGQHLEREGPLDPRRPFLEQRRFAHVSARYTKPVIITRPLTWGSGMHRIKGRNFRIDPHLYLFHFGMVDQALAAGTLGDADRLAGGWTGHLTRRGQLFEIITKAEPRDGDSFFPIARRWQSLLRPLYALNKPGTLPGKPVVAIPERFRGTV